MATGLPTFDGFTWASLLAARPALVVDKDRQRGRAIAAALEEAGAVATLAPSQALGADRLKERGFSLVVVSLSGAEPIAEPVAAGLSQAGRSGVILAEPSRRGELRSLHPAARIGDHGMDARSLVLFITGTDDE